MVTYTLQVMMVLRETKDKRERLGRMDYLVFQDVILLDRKVTKERREVWGFQESQLWVQ